MKLLFTLAALCCLSTAVPVTERSTHKKHKVSTHSTDMKRRKHHGSSPRLKSRQTIGDDTILDASQLKFLVPVTFGDQTFDLELDTGSSDTWAMTKGYTCINYLTDVVQDPSNCNYGPLWSPDSTLTIESGVAFNTSYGDGRRWVSGQLGFIDVTIADLTVVKQTVGVPDESTFFCVGSNEQSGLVGMAFSGLTDGGYPSLMETMLRDETFNPPLEPYFSIALSRDVGNHDFGGTLVIGGVPDPTDPRINSSSSYVTAPLVPYGSGSDYAYYMIQVQELWAAGSELDAGIDVIIDTGADVISVPADAADAFNDSWQPAMGSNYEVDCNAVSGGFCVGIGGEWLCINSYDLILRYDGGTCQSAVQANGGGTSGLSVLGDPFLRNVVAIYDWGKLAMEFYSRPFYDS